MVELETIVMKIVKYSDGQCMHLHNYTNKLHGASHTYENT